MREQVEHEIALYLAHELTKSDDIRRDRIGMLALSITTPYPEMAHDIYDIFLDGLSKKYAQKAIKEYSE